MFTPAVIFLMIANTMALNILVTFAQFERELIGERIREQPRASGANGWVAGLRSAMRFVTAS